jgi:hypothetical protein
MFESQKVDTVRVAKQSLKMSFSPVFPRLLLDPVVSVVLFPFGKKRELYTPLSATLLDPHAERVPGLPIRNCADISNNLVPRVFLIRHTKWFLDCDEFT